jgi:hypothetical protein
VGRDDQGRRKEDVTAISEEVLAGLRRKLCAVFRVGPARQHEVVEVLSRFEDILVSSARYASAEQFERWLEMQRTLMKRGLSRADATPSQFSRHREHVPDFLADIKIFEVAKHTVSSGDHEKVSLF